MSTWREHLGPPWYGVDDATLRALEIHETRVNALGPGRDLIDLGDALALFDDDDPDPFFNRVGAIRWPTERPPWAPGSTRSSGCSRCASDSPTSGCHPGSSARRTCLTGSSLGASSRSAAEPGCCSTSATRGPGRSGRCRPAPASNDLAADRPGAGAAEAWAAAAVVAEAFGVSADRTRSLEVEIAADLADPAADVRLIRVDGVPAAVGRRHSAGRMSYLSAIGVRAAYQGLGLGEAVTRALVEEALRAGHDLIYLGVYADNERATRMYERVGFAILGGNASEYLLP